LFPKKTSEVTMTIRIDNVTKDYMLGSTRVHALKGVGFEIGEGEFTSVAGPSGCGKSTLLNLIGCMDTPTTGEIYHDNQPISGLSDKQLTQLRLERVGFIFQSFNLIPVLNVFQNIEFPLLLSGKYSKKERESKVMYLIESVGLSSFATHRSAELSGGQRQRVAVARALVTSPKVVLADEPTANLDSVTGVMILDLMKHLNKTEKTTFIFSTHDQTVMRYATRLVKLRDGILET
jgi:putative ABC transport system ATP-binding protein